MSRCLDDGWEVVTRFLTVDEASRMCCSNKRFWLLTNTWYFKFPEMFEMMDCYARLKRRLADKSLPVVPTSHCLMRFVVSLLLRESKQKPQGAERGVLFALFGKKLRMAFKDYKRGEKRQWSGSESSKKRRRV